MKKLVSVAGSAIAPLRGIGMNFQATLTGSEVGPQFVKDTFFQEQLFDEQTGTLSNLSFSATQELDFGVVTTNVSCARHSETQQLGLVLDINCHSEASTYAEMNSHLEKLDQFISFCTKRCGQMEARLRAQQ